MGFPDAFPNPSYNYTLHQTNDSIQTSIKVLRSTQKNTLFMIVLKHKNATDKTRRRPNSLHIQSSRSSVLTCSHDKHCIITSVHEDSIFSFLIISMFTTQHRGSKSGSKPPTTFLQIIKEVREELREVLADIMRKSMLTGEIPQDWSDANVPI